MKQYHETSMKQDHTKQTHIYILSYIYNFIRFNFQTSMYIYIYIDSLYQYNFETTQTCKSYTHNLLMFNYSLSLMLNNMYLNIIYLNIFFSILSDHRFGLSWLWPPCLMGTQFQETVYPWLLADVTSLESLVSGLHNVEP